jgi:Protein of unknown function (DUF4065)
MFDKDGSCKRVGAWAPVALPDETKLAELVLYIAQRLAGDRKGGATKINKILFTAEFAHMREHGEPITGVEYQKLERGPAPRRLMPIRERLIADGDAEFVRDRYLGYPLDRLVPRRDPDLALFTEAEIKHVDEAIDALWSMNAAEASELSHREVGWRMVAMGETIPYESAFLAPAFEVTDSMRKHAEQLVQGLGR